MLPSWLLPPGVCPVEVLLSRFPDRQAHATLCRLLLLSPPCSSLVQIGKSQAAPAPHREPQGQGLGQVRATGDRVSSSTLGSSMR